MLLNENTNLYKKFLNYFVNLRSPLPSHSFCSHGQRSCERGVWATGEELWLALQEETNNPLHQPGSNLNPSEPGAFQPQLSHPQVLILCEWIQGIQAKKGLRAGDRCSKRDENRKPEKTHSPGGAGLVHLALEPLPAFRCLSLSLDCAAL